VLHADLGSANGGTRHSVDAREHACVRSVVGPCTRDCVRSVRAFVVGLGGGVARFASNIQQVSEQLEARDRHLSAL